LTPHGPCLIDGTHTLAARETFRKDPDWIAPLLWRSEFRSVLSRYMRRHGLPLGEALQLLAEAERLLTGGEYEVSSDSVTGLVARSALSAYDCEFVALAREMAVPLVTSDRSVVAAFPETATLLGSFAGK